MSVELPPLPDLSMFVPSDAARCQMESEIRAYARAVERAAYERAAQECEDRPHFEFLHEHYWMACKDCADAIRALGEQHD